MAAILRDSVAVAAVVVVRTRPRAIPLAMKTMRNSWLAFDNLCEYGPPLAGPSGRRSGEEYEGMIDHCSYSPLKQL